MKKKDDNREPTLVVPALILAILAEDERREKEIEEIMVVLKKRYVFKYCRGRGTVRMGDVNHYVAEQMNTVVSNVFIAKIHKALYRLGARSYVCMGRYYYKNMLDTQDNRFHEYTNPRE